MQILGDLEEIRGLEKLHDKLKEEPPVDAMASFVERIRHNVEAIQQEDKKRTKAALIS